MKRRFVPLTLQKLRAKTPEKEALFNRERLVFQIPLDIFKGRLAILGGVSKNIEVNHEEQVDHGETP